jgi:hypothetical protein
MQRKLALRTSLLVSTLALLGVARASAAGGYGLDWWTVDGGGGTFSDGPSYSLGGTVGQPDAGPSMSGGPYSLAGGFWSAGVGGPPTISGNAGAGGATLNYTGGSTIADAYGNYVIAVASGWSGTVTPSKANFTFAPTHKVYSGVTSDLSGEDYTATLAPPLPIVWVRPIHGSQACPAPQIGVDLLLMGITPSPWTLKLDDVDVTTAALTWELLMNPPRAIAMYTPTADLSPGVHAVEFDYATTAGPQVLTWNFTVTGLPCPTDSGSLAPLLDGSPPSSSQDMPSADRRVIDIP